MIKSRIARMKKKMMMVKPRVGRVLLATCAGSFFILILYLQSSARAGKFSSSLTTNSLKNKTKAMTGFLKGSR